MLLLLQEAARVAETAGHEAGMRLNTADLLSTVVYGVVGIALFGIAYKVFDLLTPYSLNKELLEEHNVAIGIVVAGFMIGIAIVVASAIV